MSRLVLGLSAILLAACQCGGRLETVSETISVDPDSLDFGTLTPGESKPATVTVSNHGKLEATVTRKLDSTVFSTDADDVVIEPGAKAFVAITFHPATAGEFKARLELASGGSSLGVDLIGRAQGGVTTCTPKTCSQLGRNCGALDDGCGQMLSCGSCTGAFTCDLEIGACKCPGSGREACGDGVDNDCDGAVDCGDSDCAGQGACAAGTCSGGTEIRVTTSTTFHAGGPSIAWSGTEFGIAYMLSPLTGSEPLDFGFARLDANGAVQGAPQPITTSGLMAHPPRLAWNGGEWAVASSTIASDHSGNLIEVRRVTAAGQPTGTSLVLGPGWPANIAERPGTQAFGVLWGSAKIPTFTEVAAGARTATDRSIPVSTTWVDYGDLVWSGNGWGAVWTQTNTMNTEPGVWFARLDATGAPIGQPVKVSTGTGAGMPRIAWSGTHYGIVWTQYAALDLGVRFARYDAQGAPAGATVALGADKSGWPDITWTGSSFAVVWEDARGPKPVIMLATLDGLGVKVGNDRQVSCGTAGSNSPSIAWNGTSLGITWHDWRNGPAVDVYFKRELP